MAEMKNSRIPSASAGVRVSLAARRLSVLTMFLALVAPVEASAASCSSTMLDLVRRRFEPAGSWRVDVDRASDCEFASSKGWSIKTRLSPSMARSAVDELTDLKEFLGASDDAASPEGQVLGPKVEKWISSIKRNHYYFEQTSQGEMAKIPADFVVLHFGSGKASMLVNLTKPHGAGPVVDAERADLARLGLDFWTRGITGSR